MSRITNKQAKLKNSQNLKTVRNCHEACEREKNVLFAEQPFTRVLDRVIQCTSAPGPSRERSE